MSKQCENVKAGSKGGGHYAELKVVRIDKPRNREERRAQKRALTRGTALVVESTEGVEPT